MVGILNDRQFVEMVFSWGLMLPLWFYAHNQSDKKLGEEVISLWWKIDEYKKKLLMRFSV